MGTEEKKVEEQKLKKAEKEQKEKKDVNESLKTWTAF